MKYRVTVTFRAPEATDNFGVVPRSITFEVNAATETANNFDSATWEVRHYLSNVSEFNAMNVETVYVSKA